jgi:peptidoglycan/xylan/chitin deacetylase (PgdA/CDA1 family)
MTAVLHVIMYHYIRDLPNTPFPRIKGMLTSDFRKQLAMLKNQYEMATLESALDFVRGAYTPSRDLCLLTFDDGLKEHYTEVTPMLVEWGIQGLFFVITSCLKRRQIAPVHMNHFLMAGLDFAEYRNAFLARLTDTTPDAANLAEVDTSIAQRFYRWDSAEVASFKYLFNFVLEPIVRDQILKDLFEQKIGAIESFAGSLYLNTNEAQEMQAVGMIIGGHSDQHKPLSSLSGNELESDLNVCSQILKANLRPQVLWPFCYPYGKKESFNPATLVELKRLGFACAFSTEVGSNIPGVDLFELSRLDCKDFSVS